MPVPAVIRFGKIRAAPGAPTMSPRLITYVNYCAQHCVSDGVSWDNHDHLALDLLTLTFQNRAGLRQLVVQGTILRGPSPARGREADGRLIMPTIRPAHSHRAHSPDGMFGGMGSIPVIPKAQNVQQCAFVALP